MTGRKGQSQHLLIYLFELYFTRACTFFGYRTLYVRYGPYRSAYGNYSLKGLYYSQWVTTREAIGMTGSLSNKYVRRTRPKTENPRDAARLMRTESASVPKLLVDPISLRDMGLVPAPSSSSTRPISIVAAVGGVCRGSFPLRSPNEVQSAIYCTVLYVLYQVAFSLRGA